MPYGRRKTTRHSASNAHCLPYLQLQHVLKCNCNVRCFSAQLLQERSCRGAHLLWRELIGIGNVLRAGHQRFQTGTDEQGRHSDRAHAQLLATAEQRVDEDGHEGAVQAILGGQACGKGKILQGLSRLKILVMSSTCRCCHDNVWQSAMAAMKDTTDEV